MVGSFSKVHSKSLVKSADPRISAPFLDRNRSRFLTQILGSKRTTGSGSRSNQDPFRSRKRAISHDATVTALQPQSSSQRPDLWPNRGHCLARFSKPHECRAEWFQSLMSVEISGWEASPRSIPSPWLGSGCSAHFPHLFAKNEKMRFCVFFRQKNSEISLPRSEWL